MANSGATGVPSSPLKVSLPDRHTEPVLHQGLLCIHRIGQSASVPLIIDSGTVLGLVRDGGLLPNDHDLDVAIAGTEHVDAVREALGYQGYRHRTWRYRGRIYKIDVVPVADRLPLSLEIKFFDLNDLGDWVCPAVGAAKPGGDGPTPRARVRKLFRPLWWHVLRHGDASRFPLNRITRVDHWSVPQRYFGRTVPVGGLDYCRAPADAEDYLQYRYGNWKQPVSGWISWRDDGGYRRGAPIIG